MSTPLPEATWTPAVEWVDDDARTLYFELMEEANRAARAAAEPYMKKAMELYVTFSRPAPVVVQMDSELLRDLTFIPASKD